MMRLPAIIHYHEAVANQAGRFRTLRDFAPVLDRSGELCYSSGRGSVCFVLMLRGRSVALRCFTSKVRLDRELEMRDLGRIVPGSEFLPDEIFVFNDQGIGDYYDVVIEPLEFREPEHESNLQQDEFADFSEGRSALSVDNLWGYADHTGQIVIPARYHNVGEFSEGRAVVEFAGRMGLVDTHGREILPLEFDDVSWDGSSIAYVEKSGKSGCYDRQGVLMVECRWDWMGEFSCSLAVVASGGRYGYVGMDGELKIPTVYDSASSFDSEHSLARVVLAGSSLVIDTTGMVPGNM